MNLNEKVQVDGRTEQTNARVRSLVGGLIYLIHTRPNIAFSVGVISIFMHCPSKHHSGATKRSTVIC